MIELLDSKHERTDFDCGEDLLNKYVKTQASQDVKRKLAACFVLTKPSSSPIQGFYTLSNYSIPLHHFPESIQKKLPPSYSSIPISLLGRLVVDKKFQGKGLGKILLIDALKRSFKASLQMGSFAVAVDPIDSEARVFYEQYGFITLPDSGKMFITMKTLKELFK
ncbi:GNAT family N-acetyltransferase [Aquirufa ecclesiirivi]|uniref:GNAT family N-acetyltransferase n=1 Tax=Aquirufa ecclesiirivi TaxID=2715124 RepID=A0ABT4JG52_9BACT|nr:GNAT family N-acetyltransferase [Aquirufa ecclesiirivi]MCZ2474734.1 GNAT family N-acetyltransferase [Aquirufa ecclesiirivi]